MTKKKAGKTPVRTYRSAKFKHQALLRATKECVPAVARDLDLAPAQLYAWRAKSQQHAQDRQAQHLMQSELVQLKRELARVEEKNAFLKKAAAYFAKQPK